MGENVKLLTYVSIFYLPLAFCAVRISRTPSSLLPTRTATDQKSIFQSLWAIPNITDMETRTPFIVTAILVGFVTYGIVFNMSTRTGLGKKAYNRKREKLEKEMQEEEGKWRDRGQGFEEFKPITDNRVPWEWWIAIFGVKNLFASAQKKLKRVRKGLNENARHDRVTRVNDLP